MRLFPPSFSFSTLLVLPRHQHRKQAECSTSEDPDGASHPSLCAFSPFSPSSLSPPRSLFSSSLYSTMWNFFRVARDSHERSLHHSPLSDSDDETIDLSRQHPRYFPFSRDGHVRVMLGTGKGPHKKLRPPKPSNAPKVDAIGPHVRLFFLSLRLLLQLNLLYYRTAIRLEGTRMERVYKLLMTARSSTCFFCSCPFSRQC
jgi:hypothetical protein